MSSNFRKMINAADSQPEPQRLLFMLAKSEIDSSNEETGHHGTITPILCVDKLPSELSTFEDFVAEADHINNDWDMIFMAGIGGENQQVPTPEEAEPILNKMVDDLMNSQDLSRYMVIDRDDLPVDIVFS
jgi:hypothetical protein